MPSRTALEETPQAGLLILVDNKAEPGLEAAWGLSILVEAGGRKILFDTGPDPHVLSANAAKLAVDLSEVDAVVISHGHLDHTGGLSALLPYRDRLTIYVPGPDPALAKSIRRKGFKVHRVHGTTPVSTDVYVVKPLEAPGLSLYEEGLAVRVEGFGLAVLGGCSHPNISRIAAQAAEDLEAQPRLVAGGFHLAGKPHRAAEEMTSLLRMGARHIAPLHCSGEEPAEYLKAHAPDTLLQLAAGDAVTFSSGSPSLERLPLRGPR